MHSTIDHPLKYEQGSAKAVTGSLWNVEDKSKLFAAFKDLHFDTLKMAKEHIEKETPALLKKHCSIRSQVRSLNSAFM